MNHEEHPEMRANGAGDATDVEQQFAVRPKRRRLIGGAAGGVGVLLAVQARTALGVANCQSPSALVSGNTSPRPGSPAACSGGRSPGFWKQPQKFQYWGAAGATPPTFNVATQECAYGLQNLTQANIVTSGTAASVILPGISTNAGAWAILAFPTSFGSEGQLMRHLIAAWFNAGYFQDYPITRQQVADMWAATATGGTYCPRGMTCTTNAMSGAQIIQYISSMYDFNAAIENDICRAQ